ncbi:MAG: hypothetical protein NT069_26860 [Planctomycetota bacterium]|nr:hypothetical protein [Planctomycetota bacterium]
MSRWRVCEILCGILLVSWGGVPAFAAGSKVAIVVDAKAPSLERTAGTELASLLGKLYDADAKVVATIPADETPTIVIGSPATNSALKPLAAGWPKLSDQGHLVRSSKLGNRPVLLVGGGSPVATLWAAYELGHQFGARYMLYGDVIPEEPAPFHLDGFDIVLEPNLKLRTWRTVNDFPIGPESWGLEEEQKFVRQLAKLKYNRVLISIYPWQPFVHFEFEGVAKQSALLWFGYQYRVDGDAAGRGVFKGAKLFENPDFAGKTAYADRIAAGKRLIGGIIDAAHDLGMTAGISISPLEFPKEFAAVLPGAQSVHQLETLTIGPGPMQKPGDKTLHALAQAQIRGYLNAYPTLDVLYLTLPEFPGWAEHHADAWKRLASRSKLGSDITLEKLTEAARNRKTLASGERGVAAFRGNVTALDFLQTLLADPETLKRPEGGRVEMVLIDADPALFPVLDRVAPAGAHTLNFIDYTARRSVASRELLADIPTRKIPSSLILTLADDNVGMLPQSSVTALHELTADLRKHGFEGFSTRYWMPGDLDLSAYYLSRSSFDSGATPTQSLHDLVAPLCGEGVVDRVQLVFDHIEQATALIEKNDIGFSFPIPGVVLKHYESGTEVPAWWGEVSAAYLNAMNEAYRANQRSRLEGRSFTLYLARRLDFAFNYMTAMEAVKKAGIAKRAGDKETHATQLQAAVDALHDALNAQAAVARSNSDRGVIAVLNEYGYRPLKRELESLEE